MIRSVGASPAELLANCHFVECFELLHSRCALAQEAW